jgi:putative hydrolase of the HAD superfamily
VALGGVGRVGAPALAQLYEEAPILGSGVEAVLLDGLGTLVALEPPWSVLVALLREEHGLALGPADAERAFRTEIAYYRAHHHEGGDGATLDDLRRRCAEVLRAQLPAEVARALSPAQTIAAMLDALRFSAYPDAPPALRALRARGLRLVVVSNWDISLPAVLERVGVAELLDGVVTSAQVGKPKPEGAIFAAALTLAGVAPQSTVHVGDSIEHDVRGAQAAGIHPVLLHREEAEPPKLQSRPPEVPVIASLAELLT